MLSVICPAVVTSTAAVPVTVSVPIENVATFVAAVIDADAVTDSSPRPKVIPIPEIKGDPESVLHYI